VIANVSERLTINQQAAQKFEGKDLISGNEMIWKLGSSIGLRSQTGFQLWRT